MPVTARRRGQTRKLLATLPRRSLNRIGHHPTKTSCHDPRALVLALALGLATVDAFSVVPHASQLPVTRLALASRPPRTDELVAGFVEVAEAISRAAAAKAKAVIEAKEAKEKAAAEATAAEEAADAETDEEKEAREAAEKAAAEQKAKEEALAKAAEEAKKAAEEAAKKRAEEEAFDLRAAEAKARAIFKAREAVESAGESAASPRGSLSRGGVRRRSRRATATPRC